MLAAPVVANDGEADAIPIHGHAPVGIGYQAPTVLLELDERRRLEQFIGRRLTVATAQGPTRIRLLEYTPNWRCLARSAGGGVGLAIAAEQHGSGQ